MNIIQRAAAPTPKFFKDLRLIGLALTAASTAALACCNGQQLPNIGLDIAKYVALAGTVLIAVSQVTVDEKALEVLKDKKKSGNG